MSGDTGNSEFLARIQRTASELMLLMGKVSTENDKAAARLDAINSNPPQNKAEVEKSAVIAASDFDLYSNELETILSGFERNASSLTIAYSEYVNSINLQNSEGRDELANINNKLRELITTLKTVKDKIKTLRDITNSIYEGNYHPRLNEAAIRLVKTVDKLFSAYEEIETFGLKISFVVNEKSLNDSQEDGQQELKHNERFGNQTNIKTFKLYDALLQYNCMFQSPAFSLWRNKQLLLENIYKLFAPFDVGLDNIGSTAIKRGQS